MKQIHTCGRRSFVQAAAGALVGVAAPSFVRAQPRQGAEPAVRVTQLLDTTADQLEASKSYAAGIRLAFADLKRTGRFFPELDVVETDGSAASVRTALDAIAKDRTEVALLGSAGERLALSCMTEGARMGLNIAHIAPWLADSQFDRDPRFFGLFASRAEQITSVLRNLVSSGVSELAVIYPSESQARALRAGTAAITDRLGIRARALTVPAGAELTRFAAALPADLPFFVLFMGNSIELALFTRGLPARGSQRYVICLSDADPVTFRQLQPGRAASVIFTQVVPSPYSSKVQIVRSYRDALSRLMDEEPNPLSLAGYMAGRYAAAVLGRMSPLANREKVLAELKRRQNVDVDGWPFAFGESGRASGVVSQTLLGAGGKLLE